MKSRSSFLTYLGALFAIGVAIGSAQQTTEAAPPPSPNSHQDWAQIAFTFKNWHGKLYVVTADRPGHRYDCKVESIEAASLTCAASGLHGPRSFSRDNIAALISPGYHEAVWPAFFGVMSAGGGIIAGGFFLASVAFPPAVILYVIGSLVVLSAGAVGIGAGNNDRPDSVVYQRPNTPLTVALR